MLPKKGRRKIIVDGILYYYKVGGCVNVTILNSTTGEIIKWYEEWKPKWGLGLKPSDVETII